MQSSETARNAVEAVVDLLARARAGAINPSDRAARGLLDLLRRHLPPDSAAAAAVGQLARDPGSESARQAAATALAAVLEHNPWLTAQLQDRLIWIQSLVRPALSPPPARVPGSNPVGVLTAVLLGAVLLAIGGVAAGMLGTSGGTVPQLASPSSTASGATPLGITNDWSGEPCVWLPDELAANPHLRDVGTPPQPDPRVEAATMTITTNRGLIEVEIDSAAAPCAAASLTHLAHRRFYDGTTCHRLVTSGVYLLQCGDPSETGMGGPAYRFAEENLPVGRYPSYPAGVVAMGKTPAPSTTSSQFFIVYRDTQLPPEYTVVGRVSRGLGIVEQIAVEGHDSAFGPAIGGRPNAAMVVNQIRISNSG